MPSNKVWLWKDQQFCRCRWNSHIFITYALSKTSKTATPFFSIKLWLIMMHHNTRFGYNPPPPPYKQNKWSGSKDTSLTKPGHSDSTVPPPPPPPPQPQLTRTIWRKKEPKADSNIGPSACTRTHQHRAKMGWQSGFSTLVLLSRKGCQAIKVVVGCGVGVGVRKCVTL